MKKDTSQQLEFLWYCRDELSKLAKEYSEIIVVLPQGFNAAFPFKRSKEFISLPCWINRMISECGNTLSDKIREKEKAGEFSSVKEPDRKRSIIGEKQKRILYDKFWDKLKREHGNWCYSNMSKSNTITASVRDEHKRTKHLEVDIPPSGCLTTRAFVDVK